MTAASVIFDSRSGPNAIGSRLLNEPSDRNQHAQATVSSRAEENRFSLREREVAGSSPAAGASRRRSSVGRALNADPHNTPDFDLRPAGRRPCVLTRNEHARPLTHLPVGLTQQRAGRSSSVTCQTEGRGFDSRQCQRRCCSSVGRASVPIPSGDHTPARCPITPPQRRLPCRRTCSTP